MYFSMLPFPSFPLPYRNCRILVRIHTSVNFNAGFIPTWASQHRPPRYLNLVVVCTVINIWQRSLLKASLCCVMTKLRAAQMDKIKVAWVTFRYFLSVPCSALQTCCLFILIQHLYVRKLQDFNTANRAVC